MFNRGELKASAKSKLGGKWGPVIGIFLIYFIIILGTSYLDEWNQFMFIPMIIITGPISLSITRIALNISEGKGAPKVSELMYGFKYFTKAMGVYVISMISNFAIVFAGLINGPLGAILMLILAIPIIILTLMFSQIIYVLADNPEISVIDAAKESCRLTKGYKFEIFVLGLSFIGFILLSVITLGLLLVWLMPYMEVTFSELYLYLRERGESIVE